MEKDFVNYNEAVDKLIKDVLKRNKGEYISHDTIGEITGIEYYTSCYPYMISKAKDRLIDEGILLKTMLGYGYKILSASEIADEVQEKFIKSIQRKMDKATRIMKNTNINELKSKEEKEYFSITKMEVEELTDKIESTVQVTGLQLRVRKQQMLREAR